MVLLIIGEECGVLHVDEGVVNGCEYECVINGTVGRLVMGGGENEWLATAATKLGQPSAHKIT